MRCLTWASLALTLAVSLSGAPALAQPKPPPTAAAYAAQAEALVDGYVKSGKFSGAVLVAKDGKPIFRKGFGLANREWDIPTTPEVEFRLGSITKQFTATAILQLAEQGKLGLDDPISKYYAAAPATWAPVTLRHLLTHTSGIPSYTGIPGFFGNPSRADMTPEEIIALTRDKPLEFTPGSKFAYDNTGYVLLGHVIEKVSRQPYQAYLQDHIFAPLGLAHTGYEVSTQILPRRAAGYSVAGPKPTNTTYLSMTLPYAAGSLYSTVDDLLAWDQALHANKPLKAASVQAMFTDYGQKYGFGQFISLQDGHRVWDHAGGINGFATDLRRYPDDGLTVVVLANIQEAPSPRIAAELADLYLGIPIPAKAKPVAIKLAPTILQRYVGSYRLTPTLTVVVTLEGDHLGIQATSQPKLPAYPSAEREFFLTAVEVGLTFTGPTGGKATGVVVHQGGTDTPGPRVD